MTQAEIALAAPEPAAAAERRGILRLLAGMLFKPRSTLAYLRDFGGRTWIAPALLAFALLVLSQFVTGRVLASQVPGDLQEVQGQSDPGSGEEFNIEPGAQPRGQFFIGPGFRSQSAQGDQGPTVTVGPAGQSGLRGSLFRYGLPLAGLLGGWLVRGGLLYALALVLGGKSGFGAMFRMGVWTTLPDSARWLVTSAATLITGNLATSGLSSLIPAREVSFGAGGVLAGPSLPDMLLGQLLSRLDLYTLWGLILLVIGVAVTARFSWKRGLVVTSVYWGLSLALAVLPALVGFGLLSALGGGPGRLGGPVFIGP